MRRMRNNNLEIRITGSSHRPQQCNIVPISPTAKSKNWVPDKVQRAREKRELKIRRRRRQRQQERHKSNRFNKENNNFARASRFFVHFFDVFARLRRENV